VSEPESRTIECPACGATVPVSADDVVAEHNKGTGPCAASGWTMKKGCSQ
jgi:hypothetical protein